MPDHNFEDMAPLFDRVWLSEDSHGHRYMAQLTDGANGVRWLLPLPRNEFEQLYAAIVQAHPELSERFGSPVNMLRQFIGNLMYHLVQMAQDDPALELPPQVEMAYLNHLIATRRERQNALVEILDVMKSQTLPLDERTMAYNLLEKVSDEELNRLFDVPMGMSGRHRLREMWEHM